MLLPIAQAAVAGRSGPEESIVSSVMARLADAKRMFLDVQSHCVRWAELLKWFHSEWMPAVLAWSHPSMLEATVQHHLFVVLLFVVNSEGTVRSEWHPTPGSRQRMDLVASVQAGATVVLELKLAAMSDTSKLEAARQVAA